MKNDKYIATRDHDGRELLCPVAASTPRAPSSDDALEDCVERDVTERYSGNFTVED